MKLISFSSFDNIRQSASYNSYFKTFKILLGRIKYNKILLTRFIFMFLIIKKTLFKKQFLDSYLNFKLITIHELRMITFYKYCFLR